AWALTVRKLCHNQAFCGLCDAQFLCLLQFNSNFASGNPTIMPYELILSRYRGTVGHIVLDVYASHLITLTPPEYGAACETLLSIHLFHPAINL
ncbi:hypothetical protein AVEN_163657-1, partial [Araneus ventricosus]